MTREGTIPEDVIIANKTCQKCQRRASAIDYLYCKRCLILIERETGEKPLKITYVLLEEKKKRVAKRKESLCQRCGRREPVEHTKYCVRCTILMERESKGPEEGED